MMKETTDEQESLLKWLRIKQERFGSLKNASFELLSEHPNKTINVCSDGPKLLVLPNASDILYCYTSDQWIEKLWSDMRLSAFHYPIIVLNILIFLFGTTGNIFVCLSVYRNHQLRNVTNYFIVNLAFADFLVILICLPATVVWDLSLTWFFGTIPCKLVMFLQDVSISVSVLTLTAISIDRYYAVCYPLKFKSSLNQAKKMIFLIWIVSLILMAPDLIYLSAKMSPELAEAGLKTVLYSDCNYDWSERSSRIFQFIKTILLYLLPLILMLCAHFKIMQTLQQASKSATYQLEQVITTPHSQSQSQPQSPPPVLQVNQDCKIANERALINERRPPCRPPEAPSNETNQMSSLDKLNLSVDIVGQEQVVAASSAPANINPLYTTASASSPLPVTASSDVVRNMRQIRFAGSSTGSGQSNAPSSRQSTTTTTTTTTTLPATVVGSNETSLSNLGESGSVNNAAEHDGRRRLSKSFNEVFTRFKFSKANCTSFTSTTSENQSSEFIPVPFGRKFRDYRANGSICSTSNQFEMKGAPTRGSITNINQLMMVTMHNKTKLESRRTAAKMLMTIVVMFGICYLPVHLINFLRQFLDDIPQTDVTSTISMLSHCVCYLNSAINPIIYNHMNSIFRAEFRKFLSCFHWNRDNNNNNNNINININNINNKKAGEALKPSLSANESVSTKRSSSRRTSSYRC